MSTLFLRLLNVSMTMGIIILMLLVLTPIFRKHYNAKWKYWVWLLLAVRLLVPLNVSQANALFVVNVPAFTSEEAQTGEELLLENMTAGEQQISQELQTEKVIEPTPVPGVDTYSATTFIPDIQTADTQQRVDDFYRMPGTPMNWVAWLWFVGMACYALYYMMGHFIFRARVMREGHPATGAEIIERVASMSKEMDIKRFVRIVIYPHAVSPMMIGLIHPVLILPKEDYKREEYLFILRHELTHLKRNDLWYKLVLLIANGVHWFNPLVWLMCREANADLEQSCDDVVLSDATFADRKYYTMTILNGISEQVQREHSLSTYFYGGKEELKQRFANILDENKKRFGKIALVVVMVSVALAGGLIACGDGDKEDNPDSEVQTDAETETDANGTENAEESECDLRVTDAAREIVYEELVVDDEFNTYGKGTYQAMNDGIFRVAEDGSKEWIYKGHPGPEPHMTVVYNYLYFKTDLAQDEDIDHVKLDWMCNGIRRINLESMECEVVNIGGSKYIEDFWLEDGGNTIVLKINDGMEGYLAVPAFPAEGEEENIPDSAEWQRMMMRQNDADYALKRSQKLIENPGQLERVDWRIKDGIETYLDLDMDGEPERVRMKLKGEGIWASDEYELYVNDIKFFEEYAQHLEVAFWGFSPDGEKIILAIYEGGPSADPMTRFYQWKDGKLTEMGLICDELAELEIAADGMIRGKLCTDVIQTAYIKAEWRFNAEGMLEQVPQEFMEFLWLNEVELLQPLTVYSEPGGGETFIMEPQTVTFPRATSDRKWVEIKTEDGSTGWLEMGEDYYTLKDGRNATEVFEGLAYWG